jgi:hypothetical protein
MSDQSVLGFREDLNEPSQPVKHAERRQCGAFPGHSHRFLTLIDLGTERVRVGNRSDVLSPHPRSLKQ